jgi:hypothetical protein
VSCPLILLGSVSARAPDFLHLNQASGRSDRSAIGPPTRARVIAQLLRRAVRWRGPFSELRFGEHPRACGNNPRTLLPGCADREWLPPIKIKIGNVTSSQRASA